MRVAYFGRTVFTLFGVFFAALFVLDTISFAQSKPQRQDPGTGTTKKNQRPVPLTPEEQKKADEEKKRAEEEKNAIVDPTVEKIDTSVVNIETVVYNKKTGQIVTGLKKENFAIFENGIKQNITGFATPEAPITVTLIVEYSGLSETLGRAAGGIFEPGTFEAIRPAAQFLTSFIKPPNDYASVIAFDLHPTTITDFTNDPARINQTINLLLRNQPGFNESNLFDALKFALLGGKGDSVVLENSKSPTAIYGGMAGVKSKRRAIILVASGIDSFSKINYGDMRRIIQEAGVPIYIISTGNLFYKKYEDRLGETDGLMGFPGRMSFLQAQNTMNTFASESGGKHYAMTFEGEVPDYLRSINALLRNEYALSYDLTEKHAPGTRYKLQVKVDVKGDGEFDDKNYVVQHKPFYVTPGVKDKTDKKKD